MGIADNLIRELEDEERTGKWKSIALVSDFYSHLEMIFDTTFARLEKLTWMINGGGRPVGFIGLENKKGGRLIIKVIEEGAPPEGYEPNEEILKGLVRSLGRELKKDLAMLGYPRFRHCPHASTRAGGRSALGNRARFSHCSQASQFSLS